LNFEKKKNKRKPEDVYEKLGGFVCQGNSRDAQLKGIKTGEQNGWEKGPKKGNQKEQRNYRKSERANSGRRAKESSRGSKEGPKWEKDRSVRKIQTFYDKAKSRTVIPERRWGHRKGPFYNQIKSRSQKIQKNCD